MEKEMRLHVDRFNRRRYLILWRKGEEESMGDFFGKRLDYVADLLVVVLEEALAKKGRILGSESEGIYGLYTHRYVGAKDCNAPVFIQKWVSNSSDFSYLENLYPNKLNNQMGRKLRIATFTYLPYSIPSTK